MPIPLRDADHSLYREKKEAVMSIAYNLGVEVYIFANELRRLCKKFGLNFPGMFVQAWHETDGFKSDAWRYKKNPAGIKTKTGKTYQKYVNGIDAARAFVVHMLAYVEPEGNGTVVKDYLYLDERFAVAVKANRGKNFATFHDLAGAWAEDTEYGEWVERRWAELFKS